MKYKIGSALKEDFPIFTQNRDLVFLDNAASCQKPAVVLEAMDKLYRNFYANVHRGSYNIAEIVTSLYEDAREKIARFINAASAREIIFTRNATAALNLAARSLSIDFRAGDIVLLTELEHHASLVPWQEAGHRHNLKLEFIPVTPDGRLDINKARQQIKSKPKVLVMTAMSNVTGTVTEVEELVDLAKKAGAITIIDAAQAVQHKKIDVQEINCDLLAFSSHKLFGPSGLGILWGREELLEKMPPVEYGGHMIKEVNYQTASYASIPDKFEAGTPPIAEVIGLGAAIDFINQISMTTVESYEKELTAYCLEQFTKIPNLKLIGPKDNKNRGAIFSFVIDGLHPHDLATILDSIGIAIRAGHHCVMPLHSKFGIPATARASFTIYNGEEDMQALIFGLNKARQIIS